MNEPVPHIFGLINAATHGSLTIGLVVLALGPIISGLIVLKLGLVSRLAHISGRTSGMDG